MWDIIQDVHGFDERVANTPESEKITSPILWLLRALALEHAAVSLIKSDVDWSLSTAELFDGIVDRYFRSTGLMLIALSLEVSLKTVIYYDDYIDRRDEDISRKKVTKIIHSHDLVKLASRFEKLSYRETIVLKILTEFSLWADRYPGPKQKNIDKVEELFSLSEKHELTMRDILDVASGIIKRCRALFLTQD